MLHFIQIPKTWHPLHFKPPINLIWNQSGYEHVCHNKTHRPACVVTNKMLPAPTCWLTGTGQVPALLNFPKGFPVTERVGEQLSHQAMTAQERNRGSTVLTMQLFSSYPTDLRSRRKWSGRNFHPRPRSPCKKRLFILCFRSRYLNPPSHTHTHTHTKIKRQRFHKRRPVSHRFLWAPRQNSWSQNNKNWKTRFAISPLSFFSKTRWKSNSWWLRIAVQTQQRLWAFCLFIGYHKHPPLQSSSLHFEYFYIIQTSAALRESRHGGGNVCVHHRNPVKDKIPHKKSGCLTKGKNLCKRRIKYVAVLAQEKKQLIWPPPVNHITNQTISSYIL